MATNSMFKMEAREPREQPKDPYFKISELSSAAPKNAVRRARRVQFFKEAFRAAFIQPSARAGEVARVSGRGTSRNPADSHTFPAPLYLPAAYIHRSDNRRRQRESDGGWRLSVAINLSSARTQSALPAFQRKSRENCGFLSLPPRLCYSSIRVPSKLTKIKKIALRPSPLTSVSPFVRLSSRAPP